MKNIILSVTLIAVLISGIALTGCERVLISTENGTLTTQEYNFSDFNAVEIGDAFHVEITPSDTYSVRITAGEELFKYIRVEKTGTKLMIYLNGLHFTVGSRTMEARITMPELKGLEISGAVKGSARGFKSDSDFNTQISGASEFELDMETGNFIADFSGASEVTARLKCAGADIEQSGASVLTQDIVANSMKYALSGASETNGALSAADTSIDISAASEIRLSGSGGDLVLTGTGASEITLAGFEINNAGIDLSGATHAVIDVNGKMNVSLSGASMLEYGGNPTLGDRIEITGGSSLERR